VTPDEFDGAEHPKVMNFPADVYAASLCMGDGERAAFYAAVLDYFFAGAEPSLEGAASMAFRLVRGRLDAMREGYEHARRKAPSKGSSKAPSKGPSKGATQAPSQGACQGPSQGACQGAAGGTPPGGLPGTLAPELELEGEIEIEKTATEGVAVFAARDGACGGGDAWADPLGGAPRAPRTPAPPDPPTPDEVREWAAANCLAPFDAGEFCDWYGARGWRDRSGAPFLDWHRLASSWARAQPEIDSERSERRAARRAWARGGRAGEVSADDFADLDLGYD
jgi:hypothetical protein